MTVSSNYSTYKHNVSWEEDHAYVQVMRVGETAYFSGQLAHEGEKPVGEGDFGAQCDATFVNLDKCLAEIGASRNQVVHSEVLVVDLAKNMEVMGTKHKQFFGSHRPACTVWGVTELYLPYQLVEIKLTVRLDLLEDHKTIMNGMPWEEEFGYGQIVACGSTVEVWASLTTMTKASRRVATTLTHSVSRPSRTLTSVWRKLAPRATRSSIRR
ncbi:hypothetical protein L914_03381 [Phytophthora nicotianae]|uniref:Uncharacterized protein n=1 Tax=Phytophthora nicotianae TaxID=4792 RepID=W2NYR9_PHYNI|nr:hypothetical protein L914_03381 [Phytophthora nicotianae]